MRHVVLQFWLSLDGYSCDEDTELYRLMEEIEDPEQEEYFVSRLRQAGAHIMGRVTYEEMAKFWPSSDHPIAAPMNEIPKVVFSASLQSATWPPTRIARGDAEEELARLKQEPGGEIIAHGGTQFARSLIRLGLVVLASTGSGCCPPLWDRARRCSPSWPGRLVKTTAFPSGILELGYEPTGHGA